MLLYSTLPFCSSRVPKETAPPPDPVIFRVDRFTVELKDVVPSTSRSTTFNIPCVTVRLPFTSRVPEARVTVFPAALLLTVRLLNVVALVPPIVEAEAV